MFGFMTVREHGRIVQEVLHTERELANRRVGETSAYANEWKRLALEAFAELKALRNPVLPDVGELQTTKQTTRDADTKAAQKAKQGGKRG